MHHYEIAKRAIAAAVDSGGHHKWGEQEVLQSVIVAAMELHCAIAGPENTESLVKFELANLTDEIDYDFVRSR